MSKSESVVPTLPACILQHNTAGQVYSPRASSPTQLALFLEDPTNRWTPVYTKALIRATRHAYESDRRPQEQGVFQE